MLQGHRGHCRCSTRRVGLAFFRAMEIKIEKKKRSEYGGRPDLQKKNVQEKKVKGIYIYMIA